MVPKRQRKFDTLFAPKSQYFLLILGSIHDKWRYPTLSELTKYEILSKLTHFGWEASKCIFLFNQQVVQMTFDFKANPCQFLLLVIKQILGEQLLIKMWRNSVMHHPLAQILNVNLQLNVLTLGDPSTAGLYKFFKEKFTVILINIHSIPKK